MSQFKLHIISLLLVFHILIGISLTPISAAVNRRAAEKKPIKLSVFYETLCPDSKRFFLKQLVPNIGKIEKFVELELVPFGHARILSATKMTCQHGARECEGNRLDACIQHYGRHEPMSAVVATTGCIFENRDQAKECTKKHLPKLNWDELQTCKSSDESFQMMIKFEKLTGRVPYIPRLTLNGQYDEEAQAECETDLKKCLCNRIENSKPIECQ